MNDDMHKMNQFCRYMCEFALQVVIKLTVKLPAFVFSNSINRFVNVASHMCTALT